MRRVADDWRFYSPLPALCFFCQTLASPHKPRESRRYVETSPVASVCRTSNRWKQVRRCESRNHGFRNLRLERSCLGIAGTRWPWRDKPGSRTTPVRFRSVWRRRHHAILHGFTRNTGWCSSRQATPCPLQVAITTELDHRAPQKGFYALPAAASGASALTVGALDAQAANASGASIVSNILSMQTGDATHPGLVTTAAQT